MSSINSVVFKVHPVGIGQFNLSGADIALLPNPNTGDFTVKGTIGTTDEDVTIDITNMLGQVVYHNKASAVKGSLDTQVKTGGTLAAGIYLLNLQTAEGNSTFRFVVEK